VLSVSTFLFCLVATTYNVLLSYPFLLSCTELWINGNANGYSTNVAHYCFHVIHGCIAGVMAPAAPMFEGIFSGFCSIMIITIILVQLVSTWVTLLPLNWPLQSVSHDGSQSGKIIHKHPSFMLSDSNLAISAPLQDHACQLVLPWCTTLYAVLCSWQCQQGWQLMKWQGWSSWCACELWDVLCSFWH